MWGIPTFNTIYLLKNVRKQKLNNEGLPPADNNDPASNINNTLRIYMRLLFSSGVSYLIPIWKGGITIITSLNY